MRLLLALILAFTATASQQAVRLDPPPAMVINDFVRGGQAEIDAGNVVLMYNSCLPEQGCPVWLAGHRSTHGSVFAQVADLQPGQIVVVRGVRYIVVRHELLCCSHSEFHATADLTLQTSATGGSVHIVTARRL